MRTKTADITASVRLFKLVLAETNRLLKIYCSVYRLFWIHICLIWKMNPLDSSSKWPSYDSLPSTSSFLHSESEQTEDEADVFSEGEADSGITKSLPVSDRIPLSGNYIRFPAHLDQPHLKSKTDQAKNCPDRTQHSSSATSTGVATLGLSSATPGDLVFAQKCANLHQFICPLLKLLRGLKTGRFDKGLSSFQQSVAMDRLQRILGILQRPEMGEKYLRNLLQIEVMLKIWFPQVAFQSDTPSQTAVPRLPPQWQQNQLHIPVKKRKLSWSDHEKPGKVPTKHEPQHRKYGNCQAATSLDTVSTSLPGSPKKQKTQAEETVKPTLGGWTAGQQFTDSTGTLSRPSYLCSERENDTQRQPQLSLPTHCDSPAAQDSSVSSSDTIIATYSP